jgi:hypothetical protein
MEIKKKPAKKPARRKAAKKKTTSSVKSKTTSPTKLPYPKSTLTTTSVKPNGKSFMTVPANWPFPKT